MAEQEPDAPASDEEEATPADQQHEPVFSGFGIGSALLGVLAIAGIVLGATIWTGHRSHVNELMFRGRVMQAAADWTQTLINMNVGNVDSSLKSLHDGTAGQLNADFDAAMTPFREVVKTLQADTKGQIDAVAYESVYHDLDRQPGSPPPEPPLPREMSDRTDHVTVVASSVSSNVTGKPQTVRWYLRLGVSEVDGRLLVSQLEAIR